MSTQKLCKKNPDTTHIDSQQEKRTKINTNILHEQLHRSDGVLAIIQAHNLWRDVEITQGIDNMCTPCKIMTIPAHARGTHHFGPRLPNLVENFLLDHSEKKEKKEKGFAKLTYVSIAIVSAFFGALAANFLSNL